jgi:branched-chain amino acid transport system permease protein
VTFALLNGLLIGSIYALSAMGLTLVAGLMRMVQFAHGEFFVLASYLCARSLQAGFGLPLALLSSLLAVFVAGILVEEFLLKRFLQDKTRSMMMTFMLSIILSNAFLLVFGPYPTRSDPWIEGSVDWIQGLMIGKQRLASGLVAILAFLAFYLWIRFSRTGRAIRAVAQDSEVAAAFGISPPRIRKIAFGLSTALAGLAGVVLSPIFPVVPDSGSPVTLTAISVIVIGGMGSIRGAAVSGLLLGLSESFGGQYLSTQYAPAFGFLLLILTLLFKPQGIYGNRI